MRHRNVASGLIAQVVEAYTARACSRIAKMIEVQIRKYPEAEAPLRNLSEQIKLYSLVFGPGDSDHPSPEVVAKAAIKLVPQPKPEPVERKARGQKTEKILALLRSGYDPTTISRHVPCSRVMVYAVKARHKELLNEPG